MSTLFSVHPFQLVYLYRLYILLRGPRSTTIAGRQVQSDPQGHGPQGFCCD
jgi:hypothetical protein